VSIMKQVCFWCNFQIKEEDLEWFAGKPIHVSCMQDTAKFYIQESQTSYWGWKKNEDDN